MVTNGQDGQERPTVLTQERDLFKRQFLKIQENYENKIKELSTIKELGNTLRSTDFSDKNALFWEQLNIVKKYTGLESIALMLLNEQLQVLEVVARSDSPGPIRRPTFLRIEDGPPGKAIAQKRPVMIDNLEDDPLGKNRAGHTNGVVLYIPIMHNKKAIGVLSLRQRDSEDFNQNQVRFFGLVGDQIATAVILFRLYNQMLKKEKQRFLLSRFFSKAVTAKIFATGGNLRPGGERKNVTILFADLCGFTSLSEELDQEKVVEILNAYFKRMTPIIFKYNGTLDKLMGDGILAFFGAPISHEDDPVRAVQTAIEMTLALRAFNGEAERKNWPTLKVSIGINSGEVVAGYIGSEEHLNYTVIGDAVNVAQRLQSISGPDEILISKTVQEAIQEKISDVEGLKGLIRLAAQKVKGREQAVEVYRVETVLPSQPH